MGTMMLSAEEPVTNGDRKGGRSRSLLNVRLARLVRLIGYRCERSGSRLVRVDARGTSQDCSGCGTKVLKDLSVRTHDCPTCGLVLDRDVNAARNVRARVLALDRAHAGV